MTRRSVAREAIDAARREFLRQLREWEHGNHDAIARDANDEAGDGEGQSETEDEDEEEQPNIQVEIARGVTPRMRDRIPAEWLLELAVELLPNGVLVVVAVETSEHSNVRGSVFAVLHHYANTNDLRLPYEHLDTFDYNGHQNHPDGVLLQRIEPHPELPILVVEVEVNYRTIPQLIQVATEYLQRESIHAVVGFKIFPAYQRVCRNRLPRLRKPALAVVFERVPGQAAAPFAIRVAQEVSFGSTPIHITARRSLSALPTRTHAADRDNPRVIPPSPYEQTMLDPQNVHVTFGIMAPHSIVVPVVSGRRIPGADALPNVVFDLRELFRSALRGWESDRKDEQ